MANQYNNGDPVYEKCIFPGCQVILRRTPHEVRKGNHKSCSPAHVPHEHWKYTPQDLVRLWPTTPTEELAKIYNSSSLAILKMVSILRLKGYDLPYKRKGTKKLKPVSIKPVKPKSKNVITSAISRSRVFVQVKEEKKVPVKSIPVFINSKTTVFVSDKQQVAQAREKYAYLNQSVYAHY